MGRIARKIPALALVALALWVVTPALSTTPYVPEAVDFEQGFVNVERVASGARAGAKDEGPVTHRSGVIDAPHRFDAVGLAGELRPLEIRARLGGGEWSDWIEVANGDPLIVVGGGEEAQLRTRGWRPEGKLHYVNVTGTAGSVDTALNAVRGAVSSAVISASRALSPAAQANVSRPSFISREEWGAEREEGGCPPRTTHPLGRVKAVAVHHTVTSNSYTRAQAPGIVLAICRYHRNANGWNDIGYNALVDRFGRPYVGREGGPRRPVIGAHTQGYNEQTSGVAMIGTHTSTRLTDAAFRGLAHYLAWKLNAHGLRARGKTTLTSRGGDANRFPRGKRVRVGRVFGHGRLGITACPGDRLRDQLPALRNAAQRRINN